MKLNSRPLLLAALVAGGLVSGCATNQGTVSKTLICTENGWEGATSWGGAQGCVVRESETKWWHYALAPLTLPILAAGAAEDFNIPLFPAGK